MSKLIILAVLVIVAIAFADSSPSCDQACSDAKSKEQQAASDTESKKQQAESDSKSSAQQKASDAESKKQQEESDKKSKEQQEESDLESFIQQTESDLKSQEERRRKATLEVVDETDENGEKIQKLKFRGVGVESDLEVEALEDGKARVRLSDGNYKDINIMPSTAFKIALSKLKNQDLNIRLEEFEGENFAAVYVAKSDNTVKLLGLFDVRQDLEVKINSIDGKVEFEQPWWWFLVTDADEIKDLDMQIIKPIQDVALIKNEQVDLDLGEYFLNAESYSVLDSDNVKLRLYQNLLTIAPDFDWTGTDVITVRAHKGEDVLESSFNIIASEGNLSVQTVQHGAILGEPVKWEKRVSGAEKVVLKLPKSSEAVVVKTETDVIENVLVRETEDDLEVEVIETEEYKVEYVTDAPHSVEEKVSEGIDRITIVGSEEVHYTDVLAFKHLAREVAEDSVKMFWVAESGKREIDLSKYDLNENGLVDYVEWTVPSLSNQTYELQINIINVQSYPVVGGNWTVLFNTTGQANLTISAVNGTTYGNSTPDDLTPLELRCGATTVQHYWQGNSVTYANWTCNETAYWTVKVLTPGVHTQEFNFGGVVAYAFNFATENVSFVPPTPANNSNLSRTFVFVNITSQENLNNALLEWGNSTGFTNVTMTSGSLTNWFANMTGLADGTYNYTVFAQNQSPGSVWVQTERRFVTIDTVAPSVRILYPQNVTYSVNVSSLNYTITGAANCWYTLDRGATNTSSSCSSNVTGLTSVEGSNNWTVYANDSAGNLNSSSVTFFKDTIGPIVSFGSGTAVDYANLSQNWIYVNASFTEVNLANITFTLYNSTATVNSTTYTNIFTINWTSLPETNYTYEVNITDVASNTNSTGLRRITLDRTSPTISSFTCSKSVYTLREVASCTCSATDNLDSSPTVRYTSTPETSSVGTFTTSCTATDHAGNSISSNLDYSVIGKFGGSSGDVVTSDLSSGVNRVLLEGWKTSFNINGESHTLLVKDVSPGIVSIVVTSTPQEAKLTVGEEKFFELNGDNYYDLSVKLNSIQNSGANLTIKSVRLEVSKDATGVGEATGGTQPVQEESSAKQDLESEFLILAVVVAAFAWLAYSYKKEFMVEFSKFTKPKRNGIKRK